MKDFKLAIDGPAGSGKSTISSILAKKLNWTHIDTGAMYRAVTLEAINQKIDLTNESEYKFLEKTQIEYKNQKIYLNGVDVSDKIRGIKVTKQVSLVSSFAYVRKILVEIQQKCLTQGNIIMDGRDIGTVVMPDANLKVFLTADVFERAKRRQKELIKKGTDEAITSVVDQIKDRDKKDTQRKESPLKMASDAIELDTTNKSIDQVVEQIILLIKEREE